LKERLSEARRQARLADQERRAADERAKRLEEEAKELRRHMEEYAGEPQGAPGVDDEELNTLRAELDRVKTEAEGDVDKLRQELAHAQLQASLVADSGDAEEKSRLEGEVDGLIGSLAKREGELGHLRDEAAQAQSRRREADDALRQAEIRRREADEARKQAEAKRHEVEEARGQAEESRRKAEEAREDAEEARGAAEAVVNELRQEIEEETAQHLIEEKAVRSLKLSTASRGRSSLKAVVMGVFLGVLLVISSLYGGRGTNYSAPSSSWWTDPGPCGKGSPRRCHWSNRRRSRHPGPDAARNPTDPSRRRHHPPPLRR
jgi:chromosome segregation ATPase